MRPAPATSGSRTPTPCTQACWRHLPRAARSETHRWLLEAADDRGEIIEHDAVQHLSVGRGQPGEGEPVRPGHDGATRVVHRAVVSFPIGVVDVAGACPHRHRIRDAVRAGDRRRLRRTASTLCRHPGGRDGRCHDARTHLHQVATTHSGSARPLSIVVRLILHVSLRSPTASSRPAVSCRAPCLRG